MIETDEKIRKDFRLCRSCTRIHNTFKRGGSDVPSILEQVNAQQNTLLFYMAMLILSAVFSMTLMEAYDLNIFSYYLMFVFILGIYFFRGIYKIRQRMQIPQNLYFLHNHLQELNALLKQRRKILGYENQVLLLITGIQLGADACLEEAALLIGKKMG